MLKFPNVGSPAISYRKMLCNTRDYHMFLNTTLYGGGGGGKHNVSPKYSTFFSNNVSQSNCSMTVGLGFVE